MQIQGQNGHIADVDDQSRLQVFAVSEPEDRHINERGGSYSIYFEVTPAAANDYFLYLRNTGLSNLKITDIRIKSDVVTDIYYEHVSGTPVYVTGAGAGSPATVVNRNLGRPLGLNAITRFDTDITGLTSLGVFYFDACDQVGELQHLNTTSNIIIPQGQAIAFRRQAATGLIKVVISVVVQD